jgi:hypothetical protein
MWLKTRDRLVNLNKLTDIYFTYKTNGYDGRIEYQIIVTEETGELYCILKGSNKEIVYNKFNKIAESIYEYEKVIEVEE